ncbi:hypothetical protein ACIQWN_36815 [Streptomyces vinaceus]|uniref:hypothetical protein n=1 Tax=Streptomyces vinaceus TaxID=1960 RepID=UPI003815256E
MLADTEVAFEGVALIEKHRFHSRTQPGGAPPRVKSAFAAAMLPLAVLAWVSPVSAVADDAGWTKLEPVLEKVAPDGDVVVQDDKSCFTVTVQGHGFEPSRTIRSGNATIRTARVKLGVGTDQAMGVLSQNPAEVFPDADGTILPTEIKACGVTTHGSTESDFVCTEDHVEHGICPKGSVGDVRQGGSRWVSTKVKVVAEGSVPRVSAEERTRQLDEVRERCAAENKSAAWCKVEVASKSAELKEPFSLAVSWPLKVTGKQ